jgi:hypothetical protein
MFKKTLFLGLLLSAFAVLPFTGSQATASTTPTIAKEDTTIAWWGRGYGFGGGYWGGYRPYSGGYGYGGGWGYGSPYYGYGYGYGGCSNCY